MRHDLSIYLLLIEAYRALQYLKEQLSWESLMHQILLGYHLYFQDSMC